MLERGDQLVTSALTLGEVLVRPTELGDQNLRRRYERAIVAGSLVVPFDDRAASRYAEIRHDRATRPPDAIQLACAAQAHVDLFVTNDDRLSRKLVPGIQFITSLARAPL
jgi:predicted nucleic acid-binding protein